MSKDDVGVLVFLTFFLGRPDPYWSLDEGGIENLRSLLVDLPESKGVEFPTLGYKGFRIMNRGKISGIPDSFIVFERTVSMRENEQIFFYKDVNGIEEWLFAQSID